MASINDLIEVEFIDGVLHTTTDFTDILGVVMPYHWGPEDEVNVYSEQEFYEAYPESISSFFSIDSGAYDAYVKVKSYFANGGSRVAVYRPKAYICTRSGEGTEESPYVYTHSVSQLYGISIATDMNLALKYTGAPCLNNNPLTFTIETEGDNKVVSLKSGAGVSPVVIYETFTGQITDPDAVDSDGETTYLPYILEKKSSYMQITSDAVTTFPTSSSSITFYGYWADDNSNPDYYALKFGSSDTLEATQFLVANETILSYNSSVAFVPATVTSHAITDVTPNKFVIAIDKSCEEKIKCLGRYWTITCEGGVAGAYARVAKEVNLNQVASAKTYGSYSGNLVTTKRFQDVMDDANNGIVSVYLATTGPQIFGVRNSYAKSKSSSYFSKANVSRVLAALLRNIMPHCIDAIHTATAANAILRTQFEALLNSVVNEFIGNSCLQSDSKAVCNETNNSDAQTHGGQQLNIDLVCHFIGLVEKVHIRVIATDSSATVQIVS